MGISKGDEVFVNEIKSWKRNGVRSHGFKVST